MEIRSNSKKNYNHYWLMLGSVFFLQAGNATAVDTPAKTEPDLMTHCAANEKVIFTCNTISMKKKKKNLSVCEINGDRISYRYGALNKVELTIDSDVIQSNYTWKDGGEYRLLFENKGYGYMVYHAGDNNKPHSSGVKIIHEGYSFWNVDCTDFDVSKYSLIKQNFKKAREVEFMSY